MQTTVGINTEVVKSVLSKEKLKNFIFNTRGELPFEYSGLSKAQIARVEYAQSIYLRRRPQFDAILQEIENKKTDIQYMKDFLAKLSLLSPGPLKIIVGGKKKDLITYLEDFVFPELKKDETIKVPFELEHDGAVILSQVIDMHSYLGQTSASVGGVIVGSGTSAGSFYGAFRHHIEEKFLKPSYEAYLQQNNLTAIAEGIKVRLQQMQDHVYRLELKEAREILNTLEEIIAPHKKCEFFFQEVSEDITFEAQHLTDMERISNPDMSMIERLYLCKDYQLNGFVVVPGEGKRFIVALHGIYLDGEKRERIVTFLTESGFGGSVIIYAGVSISPFEHFLIKEEKLGAIIHNTGMHHESTLREVLDHSYTSPKDDDFCWSLPHNVDGSHGSEYKLLSKDFLEKITNFF